MVSKAVLVFLFGASVAYGTILPRLHPAPHKVAVQGFMSKGCPSAPELAPLICKFLQPSMRLPYKPQLIEPMTYIPPLVVENCETPQLEMEIELPRLVPEKKPIVIPEAPSLPPITIPQFPIPVMVEKPVPPPVPIVEPCEPEFIPERPVVSIPVPTVVQVEPCLDDVVPMEPVVIPQPPELPPFVMPELPVLVPAPPMDVAPCPEDEPIHIVPAPEHIQPLAPMPAPPQLPPVRLPELPVHIEIPPRPIVSPPVIVEDPCITEDIAVPHPAPVLVPHPSRLPEPVQVAFEEPIPVPIFSDPCEPALQPVVKMGGLPPYFVKHPFFHHFRPMKNAGIPSLPILPFKK
ncbi:uncharacterized protein [Choristoneura fumiferana]|uniref:uncharacterized protein n=1 Tax=Choristoneura fumiferana TaxID=7141 RepID=UPI003D15C641